MSRSPPHRATPLAELIDGCLSEAMAKQGFASSDIVASWGEIAGEPLGSRSQPIRLDWPKRARPEPDAPPPPATLHLRVESAFALEAQHLAPLLVERINALYGWACVGRIVLHQGPVARPAPRRPAARRLDPAEEAAIAAEVAPVADEKLKAALARLGRAIAARSDGSSAGRPENTKP